MTWNPTISLTFVVTAEVIVVLRAKLIVVYIELDTYKIGVRKIESMISSNTEAIMPVSLFGQFAEPDGINSIALKDDFLVF